MLFRATGACPERGAPGIPGAPYPISLGFGESWNGGKTWTFDWERPAMSPRLEYDREKFIQKSFRDGRMFDYANGNLEDPRLFEFEGMTWMILSCRPFPTGAYWANQPFHLPPWLWRERKRGDDSIFPKAVRENQTVTMLYKIDTAALARRIYDEAFTPVCPMHRTDCDDRDVLLFPRRLPFNGKSKIACLHRPNDLSYYTKGESCTAPSIFLAYADHLTDFHEGGADEYVLTMPELDWEKERIGGSFTPIELSPGEWLLPYHGKKDKMVGYTQSFITGTGVWPAPDRGPSPRTPLLCAG